MAKTKSADTLALDKSQQKKVSKQIKRIKKGLEDGSIEINNKYKESKLKAEQRRGLIYIGHIPHGFYENEMREYFAQFGKITNVKVCRSRTTGNSKGYGYVEFSHPEVAKIAADTMNNYVMFKKRIVTQFVPYEKRPRGLFRGRSSTTQNTSVKSRRGKQKSSRNKILDDKTVAKKQKKTLKKLNSKMMKLKNLGIQCNIKPVGIDETVLEEMKLEQRKSFGSSVKIQNSDSDEIDFKKRKSTISKIKNTESTNLKATSKKSLAPIRSKRAFLTKSLDSVKALLSDNTLTETQDEETQTLPMEASKVKRNIKKEKLKGIVKIKKEKKPVVLNPGLVKKIARELIRKRGEPLLDVVSTPTRTKRAPKKK